MQKQRTLGLLGVLGGEDHSGEAQNSANKEEGTGHLLWTEKKTR